MRVRFWGTRGSIASPGPETVRHGGNTSCVQVETEDGALIIFDCGTGARRLGLDLARAGPVRALLLITHTHADHIQGLPFFVPAFVPGSHLTIYGPAGIDRSFPKAVAGMMEYPYFPVPINDLPSHLEFEELGEGEFALGDVSIRTQYLNHTAPCIGYRIQVGGVSLVYATDHEPHAANLWKPDRVVGDYAADQMLHPGDARHAEFLRGADLVIHDAQYTQVEYPGKVGWGHSTVEYATDIALAAGVRRLALFHHDPNRDDDAVERLAGQGAASARQAGGALEVFAAAEGMEVLLPERAGAALADQGPRAPRVATRPQILLAEDDELVADLLRSALELDGYEVVWAKDGVEAVHLSERRSFDLILLDAFMPEMDGFAVCRVLRADRRTSEVPIVMLTARSGAADFKAAFDAGATDYMTKPFAVAQIRARVRSWLTRSAEVVRT